MKTIRTNDLFNNNMLTVFVVNRSEKLRIGEEFVFGGTNGDGEIYKVVRHQFTRQQPFIDTTAPPDVGRTGINPNIDVPLPSGKIGLVSRRTGKRVGIVQS